MAGHSQAMVEKMQLRQGYRNVWHTDLTNAVAADLPCAYRRPADHTCFFSPWFPFCVILFCLLCFM